MTSFLRDLENFLCLLASCDSMACGMRKNYLVHFQLRPSAPCASVISVEIFSIIEFRRVALSMTGTVQVSENKDGSILPSAICKTF